VLLQMPRSGRYCFVPQCQSTSLRNPDKMFISVPRDENVKLKWFNAVRRDLRFVSSSSKTHFSVCEDHFDVSISHQ